MTRSQSHRRVLRLRTRHSCLLLGLLAVKSVFGLDAEAHRRGLEFFEKKVRPVLADNCYQCHSAKSQKLKGDLRVDSPASLLKERPGKGPVLIPGDPDDSLIVKAIRYKN